MQSVCQDLFEALEHFEAMLEKVERDIGDQIFADFWKLKWSFSLETTEKEEWDLWYLQNNMCQGKFGIYYTRDIFWFSPFSKALFRSNHQSKYVLNSHFNF